MQTTLENTDDLIPVSLATLATSSAAEIDFYLRPSSSDVPVLFCAAADTIELKKIEDLVQEGISRLYIYPCDRQKYQRYLRDNWRELLNDERQTVTDRMSIMSEVIRDVLSEQFATGTTDSIIETCQTFGSSTVALLGNEPILVKDLVRVLHHDYGTFTHSANVSAYCVMLARALGFSKEDLERIAIGGLLHDLGKLEISDRILNKPAKLDEAEFNEIRKHPTLGLQRVAHRTDLSMGQMMMIYQHHERCDGRGYPVGCSGDEIHPWAKLCAVVDVFEALTSVRPYRQPMTTQTAMAVLERGRGSEYDEEMLQCWRNLMVH